VQILITMQKIRNNERRERESSCSTVYRDACVSCSQKKREKGEGKPEAEAERRERSVRIDNPCTRYTVHNSYETRMRERERKRERETVAVEDET
jgi:hypothetical protein